MNLTVKDEMSIGSGVILLFLSSRPSNIVRRIRSIVQNSIQLVFRRGAWTDLSENVVSKRFEGKPTWVQKNTPAAVVLIGAVTRITAALLDAFPTLIKRGTFARIMFGMCARMAKPGCAFSNGAFPGQPLLAAAGTSD
jgi:hypothetical protein